MRFLQGTRRNCSRLKRSGMNETKRKKAGGKMNGNKMILPMLLFVIMGSAIALEGCTSSGTDNSQQSPQGNFRQYGGNRNRTMNLTAEQRQQMIQQRTQAEISACTGKAQGDACTITIQGQTQRGPARNATCETQQGNLMCIPPIRDGTRGFPTGTS